MSTDLTVIKLLNVIYRTFHQVFGYYKRNSVLPSRRLESVLYLLSLGWGNFSLSTGFKLFECRDFDPPHFYFSKSGLKYWLHESNKDLTSQCCLYLLKMSD